MLKKSLVMLREHNIKKHKTLQELKMYKIHFQVFTTLKEHLCKCAVFYEIVYLYIKHNFATGPLQNNVPRILKCLLH